MKAIEIIEYGGPFHFTADAPQPEPLPRAGAPDGPDRTFPSTSIGACAASGHAPATPAWLLAALALAALRAFRRKRRERAGGA